MQVETVEDYDEYCHYVAGLVGLGLSKLFHAAELEDLATDEHSNSMGLFLQVNQWHIKQGLLSISSLVWKFGSNKQCMNLLITENKHYSRLSGGY